MERYCQRCRVFREVRWNEPGTAQYCALCSEELRQGIPTAFQLASQQRRTKSRKARAADVLSRLDKHKAQIGCCVCSEADPACLDFYRDDPAEKVLNLSSLARKKPDFAFLMKEIERCKVICANCYRKRHRQLLDGELATAEESVALRVRVRSSPDRPPGFDEAMAELRRQCFSEPAKPELARTSPEVSSSLEGPDSSEIGPSVIDPE